MATTEPLSSEPATSVPGQRRRQSRLGGHAYSLTLGLSGLAAAIVAWYAAVELGGVGPLQLPAPDRTWGALWRMITEDPSSPTSLVYQAIPTLQATFVGFAIATVGGFLLGFILFESRFLGQLLWPLVIAFQALPKVALAPVLVIWFGPTIESKIVLVAIVSFFPVFINTIVGLESLDSDTEEMLKSFGAKRRHMLSYGRFPAALPVLFAGIESALLLSLVAVVVAEFVAASRGLGFMITQAQYNIDMPTEFALLIVFAVLGVILLEIVTLIEHKVVFWKTSRRGLFAYAGRGAGKEGATS
jgi:NitT/TauT family transport system permease protein